MKTKTKNTAEWLAKSLEHAKQVRDEEIARATAEFVDEVQRALDEAADGELADRPTSDVVH